ncbi:glycosyltransferase family 2 protein [Halomonas sp. C05BenzN]|uniref:glycosyltransferase family 2 protein n=1 Tax=Halomonas sp. C05BenzN TaxID=3411041 RepID=UPI003B9363C9
MNQATTSQGFQNHLTTFFFADKRQVDLYSPQNGKHLPLAVNPRFSNPFRRYDSKENNDEFDFIIDGAAQVHRHPDHFRVLKTDFFSKSYLIDSQDRVLRSKANELGLPLSRILGSVSYAERNSILKNTLAEIIIPNKTQSAMSQQRMILEATASKVIPLYAGYADQAGLLCGIQLECGNDLGLIDAAAKILQMPKMQQTELAKIYWRKVCSEHTFANRLKKIYKTVGLNFDYHNDPLVSVIAPTFRLGKLASLIQCFDSQDYKNKELIIIINSSSPLPDRVRDITENRKDIIAVRVPNHEYTGTCLKIGLSAARGELVFKMDDDDVYGRHYLTDLVLGQHAVDADLFGKPPCYIAFEGDDSLYRRKSKCPIDVNFKSSELMPGKLWVGGNSIGGKATVLREIDFDVNCYGAADTSLLLAAKSEDLTVCLHDLSNLVAIRQENTNNHTWRVSNAEFREKCEETGSSLSSICDYWYSRSAFEKFEKYLGSRQGRDQITMALASIPERVNQLHRTLLSVITQVDKIYIYLNGYESVPEFLDHPKITAVLSKEFEDLGAAGKFYWIDQVSDGYVFTIDDDIIYPGDYVARMIKALKKYNDTVAVCVHGSIFASPLTWYFERTEVFGLKKRLDNDRFVTLVGTGCLAFHRKCIDLKFSDFYPKVMCDLTFSVKAREQGIPLISINREANWLKPQKQLSNNTYYDRMLLEDGGRTLLACSYDWSFSEYGRLISAWLKENMQEVPLEQYSELMMDVEFINSLDDGSVPPLWDSSKSVVYHKRKLQKLMIDAEIARNGNLKDAKIFLPRCNDINELRSHIDLIKAEL